MKPTAVAIGFLECAWFRDPARAQAIYDRFKDNPHRQDELTGSYLFFGGLTGRRITTAFGDDLIDMMVWANCTPVLSASAKDHPPPEPDHIRRVFDRYMVSRIVCFGKVAQQAVPTALAGRGVTTFFHAPHPAARHPGVTLELMQVASSIREQLAVERERQAARDADSLAASNQSTIHLATSL